MVGGRSGSRRASAGVLVAALLTLLLLPLGMLRPQEAAAGTVNGTPGVDTVWTVPAHVTSATFTVVGASGGRGDPGLWFGNTSTAGRGGKATVTLTVTPGQVFHLFAGKKGGDGLGATPGTAGQGGNEDASGGPGAVGGSAGSGGGGGGASDVRLAGTAQANRIIVAGGGGGVGGSAGPPGEGGGSVGGLGGDGVGNPAGHGGAGGGATCAPTGEPPAEQCGHDASDGASGIITGSSLGGAGGAGIEPNGGGGGGGGGGLLGGQGGGGGASEGSAGGSGGGGNGAFQGVAAGQGGVFSTAAASGGPVDGSVTITYSDPAPTTSPATNVTSTGATLHGSVLDEGAQYRFEYGLTAQYGTNTVTRTATTAGADLPEALTGLTAGTTYHFRIFALNSAQPGADRTFTTGAAPTTTTAAPVVVVVEPPITSVAPTTTSAPTTTTTAEVTTTTTEAATTTTSAPTTTTSAPTTTLAPTTTQAPPTTVARRAPPPTSPPATSSVVVGPTGTTPTTAPAENVSGASTGGGTDSTTTSLERDPDAKPAPKDAVDVKFEAEPGDDTDDVKVKVEGKGFEPGSTVRFITHSTPVLVGEQVVGDDGSFAAVVGLPPGIEPGQHHLAIDGVLESGTSVSHEEPFSVAKGGVLGTVGETAHGELAQLVPYQPLAHASDVVESTAAGVAAVGAVGAAIGAAGGAAAAGRGATGGAGGGGGPSGGGGGSSGGGDGAYLADIEVERELLGAIGRGRGDRSRLWRWRTTGHVDRFSSSRPSRIAAITPIGGRLAIDGDYLRAMLGGGWLALFAPAVVLGVLAGVSTHGTAVPPAFGFFVAILALGIFDAVVGWVAGLAFMTTILVTGGIVDASSIRLVLGQSLVWFCVPLAAASIRPLRRTLERTPLGLWDRGADLVLCCLFGGWVAMELTGVLSPLRGYSVPIGDQAGRVALVAMACIAVRVVLETIAAHHFPDRLEVVSHQGGLEPSTLQIGLSLIGQIVLFTFVSKAYMPWSWQLLVGAVVFYSPLVPWLFADKLPKSALIAKLQPKGLAKWVWVIAAGVPLGAALEHVVHDPSKLVQAGFIFLPLPVLLCWGADLFLPEEPDEEEVEEEAAGAPTRRAWGQRLLGVPALGLCLYLVLWA